MIKAIIRRTGRRITSVEISGHSGYADSGKDIVCAAVSAIAQTAAAGLKKFSPGMEYEIRDDGYLKFTVPESGNGGEITAADAITDTLCLGLRGIEKEYGSFVRVEEK